MAELSAGSGSRTALDAEADRAYWVPAVAPAGTVPVRVAVRVCPTASEP